MKWLDIPPVWLLLCLVVAALQPVRVVFGGWLAPTAQLLAGLLVGGGLLLIALAVLEMRRHRTTVIPHRDPQALVSTGIFARSRNPIYLGDLLILAGLSLWWGSLVGLLLVPLLAYVLRTRFIAAEEARLAAAFGPAFDRYRAATRRWL